MNEPFVSLSHISDELRAQGPEALERIVKQYGPLAARIAALQIAIEKRVAEPRIKNYPPVVFLAYKWESEAHQAHVREIAEYLRGRGYRVLLDQDHLEQDASSYTEVPEYIANMVGSDVFVILASKRYVDMVTARAGQTTWVHDEYAAALLLHNNGRLRIHAIRLDPTVSLEGNLTGIGATTLGEGPGALGALDKAFPGYAGPTLDAAGHELLRAFVHAFDQAMEDTLRRAAQGVDANDVAAVRAVLLGAHANLSHLYDYQVRLCRFCLLVGEGKKAHALALQLLNDCEFDDHAIQLAQALDAVGDFATMFKFLYRQRRSKRLRGSVHYHYFMAETLLERGSVVASHNHFAWLLGSPVFAHQPSELQALFAARHRELSNVVGTIPASRLYRCRKCPAQYPCSGNLDQICGDCGTLYDRANAACPVCGNDGTVPLPLIDMPGSALLCPVCSEGELY
jgi:hypothetical protein